MKPSRVTASAIVGAATCRMWRAVAVLVASSCLVSAAGPLSSDARASSKAVVCGSGLGPFGVDVSQFQGAVDWSQVAASGLSFAYARVADGASTIDSNFDTNFTAIKAAGLAAGGYLFFEPNQDPYAQADLLVSTLEQDGFTSGDLLPMIDVEVSGGESPGVIASRLQTVGNRILSELGVYPVIYTSARLWSSLVGSTAFSGWPLWVANWNVTCPTIPTDWNTWQLWQYSDFGTVAGIPTAVDLDRGNGSLPIYSGTPEPPPRRVQTTLAVTTASSSGGDFSDPSLVSASLTDANGPVANAPITFHLQQDGAACAALTDSSGVASCTVTPSEAPQVDAVNASYGGGPTALPSTASAPFTVNEEEATLTYTGAESGILSGSTITLSARLTEDGPTPVVGQPITFALGGESCSVIVKGAPVPTTTDTTGVASCTLTVSQPLGPTTVVASFDGQGYYPNLTASANAVVFAFPAQGAFALGDRTAATAGTSTIYWWGSSWSRFNELSEGSAPPSFKGFVTTPASIPPVCATAWTTTTGPTPPTAVPSYMGVLTPGSVTQNGKTLAGDTPHIVVVKTNPGYGDDPSHPGTGTVVATYC